LQRYLRFSPINCKRKKGGLPDQHAAFINVQSLQALIDQELMGLIKPMKIKRRFPLRQKGKSKVQFLQFKSVFP